MFTHQPTQEEIVKWFSGFNLHEGLDHSQYVGGIVAIENRDRGGSQWSLYVNATARIAYFWDWVDSRGFSADIHVSEPIPREIHLPDEKKAHHFCIKAEVTVVNQDGVIQRVACGTKQVDTVMFRRGYNGAPGRILPDPNAMMKAETGAIARAVGCLGMLALPGSGIATAEDVFEYMNPTEAPSPDGVHSSQGEKPKKAMPNPKK